MNANYTIGDTPLLRNIAQSKKGDFLLTLPFIDVATDKTETPTDLTGCDFTMNIYEQDATTVKLALTVGDGITVTDNEVVVSIVKETYSDWAKGCKYSYDFNYVNATDFDKCLFEGSFSLT